MKHKARKGIILAGGSGTRLYPLSKSVSKQLMPVYDKPMIYYPLSILMQSGIREILIITKPNDKKNFYDLLGNGNHLGININYEVQKSPDGIAQCFLIAEKFLSGCKSTLILGDNIFYGPNFNTLLNEAYDNDTGATIFTHKVNDPENYGVIELENHKIKSIEEKPELPKSNYVVTGLYYYDEQVVEYAKSLKPSHRGELEITDINNIYLENSALEYKLMDEKYSWLDTGTHDSLLQAGNFIASLESKNNKKICCPEEISFNSGWITNKQLQALSESLINTNYGKYLMSLIEKNNI